MIPSDERYYLTTLKRLPEEQCRIPEIGEQTFHHLDRDYEECERFYALNVNRQTSWISFVLIRQWDWEIGEIDEPVFEMIASNENNRTQYVFAFKGIEISLGELQDDFIVADFFQPLDLFGTDSDTNIMLQFKWFLALCGTFPYVNDYVVR